MCVEKVKTEVSIMGKTTTVENNALTETDPGAFED